MEVASADPTASAMAQPAFRQIDACSLLTSTEIESVQGEAVTGTIPSGGALSGFPSTQCVFTTVTPVNSVGVVITQTDPKSGLRVRNFGQETFHAQRGEKKGEEEHDEKKAPPRLIPDLGDEAFLIGPADQQRSLRAERRIIQSRCRRKRIEAGSITARLARETFRLRVAQRLRPSEYLQRSSTRKRPLHWSGRFVCNPPSSFYRVLLPWRKIVISNVLLPSSLSATFLFISAVATTL